MRRLSFIYNVLLMALAVTGLASCNDEFDNNDPGLTGGFSVGQQVLEYTVEGGSTVLNVGTKGGTPTVTCDAQWVTIGQAEASARVYSFTVSVPAYDGEDTRTANIQVSAADGTATVQVKQFGTGAEEAEEPEEPDNRPLPDDGVESSATELIAKMGIGWNIGNTLEAAGGETAWGNPRIDRTLIDGVRAAGFNAVRIPCSWDSYIDDRTTYHISDEWMARVKEVVDLCLKSGMYVVLNSHYDNGWLELNPTTDKADEVNAEQQAIWTQIATVFRDYDEHLLFAGTNEVHLSTYASPSADNLRVQESFNQTFVDAVRATGGNNARRVLVVQSWNTEIWSAVNDMTMPTDAVSGRLAVEVHYYDPYGFTLNEGSDYTAYWGYAYSDYGIDSYGQEDAMETALEALHTRFSANGIPVIVGEYGAMRRDLGGYALTVHQESRAYWYRTFNEKCAAYGIKGFVWDTGITNNQNAMGLFVRSTGTVSDTRAVEAIKAGAGL